jgi:hypothetical protein
LQASVAEAEALLGTTAPQVADTPAVYAPMAPLPEAPASVNCYLTIDGHRCQVTLRDGNETRLLTRLGALLAQFPQAEGGDTEPPAARQGAVQPPPSCRYHGPQDMRPSKYGDGRFYCGVRLSSDDSLCGQNWPPRHK